MKRDEARRTVEFVVFYPKVSVAGQTELLTDSMTGDKQRFYFVENLSPDFKIFCEL